MRAALEKVKVFFVVKFIWGLFPAVKNAQIASFANTEFTTSWHFRYCLEFLKSPAKKAQMFEQLLEEYHHADIFLQLARRRSDRPVFLEPVEIKPIYPEKADAWKVVVYSHVGEQAAVDRFSSLISATEDPELKKVIIEVLADERGHTEGVMEIAEELGRSPKEIASVSRQVKIGRAWEAWLRHGNRLTGAVVTLVFSAVYFLFGVLLVFSARKRLRQRLFMREDSLKQAV